MTHYVPAFTEVNGPSQKAACGAWVRAHDHSNEPTCDACKAYVESDAAADALTAEDVFGPAPDSYPPLREPFDPCQDYSERRAPSTCLVTAEDYARHWPRTDGVVRLSDRRRGDVR